MVNLTVTEFDAPPGYSALTVKEGDVPSVPAGGTPETTPVELTLSHAGAPADRLHETSESHELTVVLYLNSSPVAAVAVVALVIVGPVVGFAMFTVTERGLVDAAGDEPVGLLPRAATVSLPIEQVSCV